MNAKSVEELAPEVEEKLAIHGLEEKVKAKRAAVEQLESKEMDLEKILKGTTSVAPAGTQQPKQPKTMENKKKKRKWVLSAIKARAFEDH